jgi:signal transduction histidine kinase
MSVIRRWAVSGPLLSLLLIAAIVALFVPADVADALGAVGLAVGLTTAGVLTIRRSTRLARKERRAWVFLAAGLFSVAAGVIVVAALTTAGVTLPAFGPVDIFFLGGYAMLLIMFYKLARSDTYGSNWVPTLLDALVGGIALSVLVWTAFYRDLIDGFQGSPAWEQLVAVSYPVIDVAAVIGLMILVIRRSHYRWDPRLVFLALGLAVQIVADFVYLKGGVGQTFDSAHPQNSLLLLATMCYLTAATLVDRAPAKREYPERDTPLAAMMWPYLLAVALLATHVVRYHRLENAQDETLLLDALLLIGAVIFLRQVVMIHLNRIRVENQRSDLVASVSHELRTPLTAMVGYLTLLDEEGDDFPEQAQREMISAASDQARHIARLVSDLVMLARGTERNVPLEVTKVRLSSIITDALRAVDTGGIRVEELLLNDPIITVDSDRMRQAVTNLLTNAVRYGNDYVTIIGKVVEDTLVLEVHDNGRGVPTRYETAIWGRFERGAHRLDATTPGMGIGLSIVQAIAQAHGGRAEYRRSERLGGACFTVTIPGAVVRNEAETSINV